MLYILIYGAVVGAVVSIFYLFVALTVYSDWKYHYIDWDGIKKSAKWLVIFIAIGLIGVLGYGWISSFKYCQTVQTTDFKLLNSHGITRSSWPGFYVYRGGDFYSFYYQNNENKMIIGKVEVDNTTIYEEDCIPHIVEYTTYTKHPMNKILLVMLTFEDMESSQKTYKIYTPKGTVLTSPFF